MKLYKINFEENNNNNIANRYSQRPSSRDCLNSCYLNIIEGNHKTTQF